MLTLQLCALVLLVVCVQTAQFTGIDCVIKPSTTETAKCSISDKDLPPSRAQSLDQVDASDFLDACSSTSHLSKSEACHEESVTLEFVVAKLVPIPRPRALLDFQKLIAETDVEAGARNILLKTGVLDEGSDLVNFKHMFGSVELDMAKVYGRKLTIGTLPKPIAANLVALLNAHRKLDAYFIGGYMDAINKWYRSMRVASNAIESETNGRVITRHTRAAIDDLIDSTNSIMTVVVESVSFKQAVALYHAQNTDKLAALLDQDLLSFQEYLSSFTDLRLNAHFSTAAAVAHAVCMTNKANITTIDTDLQHLTDEEKSVNNSMTERLDDHIAYFRNTLVRYRWITDTDVDADPKTFSIVSNRLLALSNELHKKLTSIRAISIRKIAIDEQKKTLNVHKSILFERSEYTHKLLHSMRSTVSNDVLARTETFVTEILSSGMITRALDDEECQIVAAVDKVTGRKHRKTRIAVSSAPDTVCWDEIRKGQCMERLDAAIVSERVNVDLNNEEVDQVTAILGHTVVQFKSMLLERVELMTTMRNSIHILDDRKTISATGKRYKAVKLEIDAVRDSFEKMIKAVKELVARKSENKAIVSASVAAITVLDHLRAEIAAAETFEAVNRAIAKVAEDTNQQENSSKCQAAAQAKSITRIATNANTAKLAWLDAFSRILTHTNRLESILDTAFKANRVLDAGELRHTDIRLAKMTDITAEILENVDIEQMELAKMRKAETIHAEANARAAAFAKLSTQSRLKAIIFDGASQ